MLGPGLNLSGILPPGGLMPTMQSAAQTGKRLPITVTGVETNDSHLIHIVPKYHVIY